jgi:hypothetical protein
VAVTASTIPSVTFERSASTVSAVMTARIPAGAAISSSLARAAYPVAALDLTREKEVSVRNAVRRP